MDAQYKTISEYIKSFAPDVREVLERLRQTIHEAAPDAREVISYNMPAFKQNRVLVYFAARRDYIGFYPTASGIAHFKSELAQFKPSKGAIRFPLSKPIPYDLIEKIVRFRAREDAQK